MAPGFNWIDIVILAVIAVSFLFGLWRGLVKEVLSLLTWIAALFVARIYSEHLAPMLSGVFDGETTRNVAAFAILFIVIMMLGTLLNHFIGKLLTITGLKFTDRLLGGVFGIARGVIIVMLILFFTRALVSDSVPWQESQLIPRGLALIEWSQVFIGDFSGAELAPDLLPTQTVN